MRANSLPILLLAFLAPAVPDAYSQPCDPVAAVNHYAAWGGIPRYWELAREYPDWFAAIQGLVLDPLGVLHREPERLLLDDLTELARAASLLALIGQGCHRVSELAGRLGVPSTSLSRPLARLVDLGFAEREIPFGLSLRDTKRTQYRIANPFLRLWYRFVEPNRSRLVAGQIREVAAILSAAWPQFLAAAWEDLARASVARLRVSGVAWTPAGRWWGRDEAGRPLEIDLVAEAADGSPRVLVGEAKLSATARDVPRLLAALRERAARCPVTRGRDVVCALWRLQGPRTRDRAIVTGGDVLRALR